MLAAAWLSEKTVRWCEKLLIDHTEARVGPTKYQLFRARYSPPARGIIKVGREGDVPRRVIGQGGPHLRSFESEIQ